jgi:hypothetical protein
MRNEGPRIAGAIHPATKDGFRKLLAEANRVERDGYELVTVVQLDIGLGCVFRRRATGPQSESNNSFFE